MPSRSQNFGEEVVDEHVGVMIHHHCIPPFPFFLTTSARSRQSQTLPGSSPGPWKSGNELA